MQHAPGASVALVLLLPRGWPAFSGRCSRPEKKRVKKRSGTQAVVRLDGEASAWIEQGSELGFPLLSGREWQFDSKRGSPANLRSKVYRTVVKLHNSKRAGQSDSATPRPGGEKQLKNFLLIFRRDAFAGVAHGDFRHFTAPAQHQPQLSAVGHGFG